MNPVLREGNSDRRAPASVKEYVRNHPHSMGDWSKDSKSHVATMSDGDFRSTEQSLTLDADDELRIEHVAEDGTSPCSRSRCATAGEIIDGAVMRRRALDAFLEEQIDDAKEQGVLFSLHLKATMMKVSDPIIFGHAVRAFFADVFAEHGDALAMWRQPEQRPGEHPERARGPAGRRARGDRGRDQPRPTRAARTLRWSTPTAASPTCTSPAT